MSRRSLCADVTAPITLLNDDVTLRCFSFFFRPSADNTDDADGDVKVRSDCLTGVSGSGGVTSIVASSSASRSDFDGVDVAAGAADAVDAATCSGTNFPDGSRTPNCPSTHSTLNCTDEGGAVEEPIAVTMSVIDFSFTTFFSTSGGASSPVACDVAPFSCSPLSPSTRVASFVTSSSLFSSTSMTSSG